MVRFLEKHKNTRTPKYQYPWIPLGHNGLTGLLNIPIHGIQHPVALITMFVHN